MTANAPAKTMRWPLAALAALLAAAGPAGAAPFDTQIGTSVGTFIQHTLRLDCGAAAVSVCFKTMPAAANTIRVDFIYCDITTETASGAATLYEAKFVHPAPRISADFVVPLTEYAAATAVGSEKHSFSGNEPLEIYQPPNGGGFQLAVTTGVPAKIVGACTVAGRLLAP